MDKRSTQLVPEQGTLNLDRPYDSLKVARPAQICPRLQRAVFAPSAEEPEPIGVKLYTLGVAALCGAKQVHKRMIQSAGPVRILPGAECTCRHDSSWVILGAELPKVMRGSGGV